MLLSQPLALAEENCSGRRQLEPEIQEKLGHFGLPVFDCDLEQISISLSRR